MLRWCIRLTFKVPELTPSNCFFPQPCNKLPLCHTNFKQIIFNHFTEIIRDIKYAKPPFLSTFTFIAADSSMSPSLFLHTVKVKLLAIPWILTAFLVLEATWSNQLKRRYQIWIWWWSKEAATCCCSATFMVVVINLTMMTVKILKLPVKTHTNKHLAATAKDSICFSAEQGEKTGWVIFFSIPLSVFSSLGFSQSCIYRSLCRVH